MPRLTDPLSNGVTEQAALWLRSRQDASEARTRTHVPHHQTEGTVVADDTSEVTAQRITAAFNAVHDAAAYLLSMRADLQMTPIGRQWIEDAEAMQRLAEEPR